MFCKRNTCDFIKGYRVRGERYVRIVAMGVSGYVFAYCRDIIDLMRRGEVW